MIFKIYAPAFHANGGGVGALYNLKKDIEKLGYNSEIVPWHTQTVIHENDIIIYPEVISDNPLFAKNVVRYMLNREAVLTGKKIEFGNNDFILTWSNLYHKNPHATLLKHNIAEYFNDTTAKNAFDRYINCTYIGKGSMYQNCSVIKNTIFIDKNNPISKNALADLLKNTRILYTYDACSSIVTEAIMCGAMVVPLLWNPFTEEEYKNSENKFPYINVSNNMIMFPDNYSTQRDEFIQKIKTNDTNYFEKLNTVICKIFQHFNIDSPKS
jgi:hypothetical protein